MFLQFNLKNLKKYFYEKRKSLVNLMKNIDKNSSYHKCKLFYYLHN